MNKAISLTGSIAAMVHNGSLTIFESQQEFEGDQGMVVPAKSIWINAAYAKQLRDFLIEQYPIKGEEQ